MRLPALGESTCAELGGKAAPLAGLRRAGFPVPRGVVVPLSEFARHLRASGARAAATFEEARELLLAHGADDELRAALTAALDALPGGRDIPVAVRSSATTEDAQESAGAGLHETVLGARGPGEVAEAVVRCWASWWSPRRLGPRSDAVPCDDGMAVLVQVLVDADASGVLFTGERRVLEAVHGLGESLVGGAVTPDAWELCGDGIRTHSPGSRDLRAVRRGGRVVRERLPAPLRDRAPLDADRVREIDALGRRVAEHLGAPVDLEWAVDGAGVHVLQARPITASLPASPTAEPAAVASPAERASADGTRAAGTGTVLHGVGASGGTATGTVRPVRSVAELSRVRSGDVLLARVTDPAWTPLFPLIAAVVTETGGMLSHAAIVAREVGIPAVLAVPDVLERLEEGAEVRVDGERGTITLVASDDG